MERSELTKLRIDYRPVYSKLGIVAAELVGISMDDIASIKRAARKEARDELVEKCKAVEHKDLKFEPHYLYTPEIEQLSAALDLADEVKK